MAAAATNGLLGFARLSVLSSGGATNGTSAIPASLRDGALGYMQELLASWFKLDITTLAVMLTIFGTVSGALKDLQVIALKVYWWFTKLFTASISIASNDRLNREILNWVGANVLTRQETRILTARTEVVENDAYGWSKKIERNELHEKRVPIQFLPTFGTTWFVLDRNIFLVRRVSTRSTFNANSNVPDEYAAAPEGDEPLVVMCLGRSVAPIKKFLESCRDFAEKEREAFITIRASKNEYHQASWDTTILRPIRPLETVHFDEKVKQELVADIGNYLSSATRKFYTSRGIPYRRGFLLHGTPGTGKTSLSLALAGLFGLELYLVHLPSVREDAELTKMFTSLPSRCIVLLEDIDAVGVRRQPVLGENNEEEEEEEEEPRGSRTRCTLSGLLNVLDGVASQEGRIVLMTSNHAEKLDKALVRPGRIDRKIYMGLISQRSAELMFLRMYGPDPTLSVRFVLEEEKLEMLAATFSTKLPDETFTPAQLQGYLLNYRDSPVRATEEVSDWVVEEKAKMEADKEKEKKIKAWRAEKKKRDMLKVLAKSSRFERDDLSPIVDRRGTGEKVKEEVEGDLGNRSVETNGVEVNGGEIEKVEPAESKKVNSTEKEGEKLTNGENVKKGEVVGDLLI